MLEIAITIFALLLFGGVVVLLIQEPDLIAAGLALALGLVFVSVPLLVTVAPLFVAFLFAVGAISILYGVGTIARRRRQILLEKTAYAEARQRRTGRAALGRNPGRGQGRGEVLEEDDLAPARSGRGRRLPADLDDGYEDEPGRPLRASYRLDDLGQGFSGPEVSRLARVCSRLGGSRISARIGRSDDDDERELRQLQLTFSRHGGGERRRAEPLESEPPESERRRSGRRRAELDWAEPGPSSLARGSRVVDDELDEDLLAVEQRRVRLAARRAAAERETAEREAAQREAAQREAAGREAAEREAAEREVARREAAEREAAYREQQAFHQAEWTRADHAAHGCPHCDPEPAARPRRSTRRRQAVLEVDYPFEASEPAAPEPPRRRVRRIERPAAEPAPPPPAPRRRQRALDQSAPVTEERHDPPRRVPAAPTAPARRPRDPAGDPGRDPAADYPDNYAPARPPQPDYLPRRPYDLDEEIRLRERERRLERERERLQRLEQRLAEEQRRVEGPEVSEEPEPSARRTSSLSRLARRL